MDFTFILFSIVFYLNKNLGHLILTISTLTQILNEQVLHHELLMNKFSTSSIKPLKGLTSTMNTNQV